MKDIPPNPADRSSDWFIAFVYRTILLGLQLIAIVLLGSLALKALFNVSIHSDAWWYHLPWASRLVGLTSAEDYLFEPLSAVRYEGFPLLPELLQGVFWRVTGRVESANLVSFLSLVGFILFLRHFLRTPWWLSIPALLAVPLVQAHAASAYVDLIGNLALAAFLLMLFRAFVVGGTVSGAALAGMMFAAAIAANSKLQLIPLVAVGCLFMMPLVWRWWSSHRTVDQPTGSSAVLKLALVGVGFLVIFFVPIKNTISHGNPAYPVNLTVFGYTLPHAEVVFRSSNEKAKDTSPQPPKPVRWLSSVLELRMGMQFDVSRWSLDSTPPPEVGLRRYGGLFGLYVLFQIALASWLVRMMNTRERTAFGVFAVLSVGLAMMLPGSLLLRYYMFWFVGLISANLFFAARYFSKKLQVLLGIVFLGFTLVVIDTTDQNFIRPSFYSVADLFEDRLDSRVLEQLTPRSRNCLVLDRVYKPFLYASLWHDRGNYSIKAGPGYWPTSGIDFPTWASSSPEVSATCGDWAVIYEPTDEL